MTSAIIVFAIMTALDFVWARYTAAVTDKRRLAAALYSGAIVGLGGFSTISYVDNHWMLIPAVAGALFGTYLAVR